jgi:hypothetical protein
MGWDYIEALICRLPALEGPVGLTADSFSLMTALSCLALGFGFAVAVGLLVFAGVVIGWIIPYRRRAPRKGR